MEQHLDQEQLEQVTTLTNTLTLTKTLTMILTLTKTMIKTKERVQNYDVRAVLHRCFQVQAAFALFDHDGDGRITIEELRHLYTSLGQSFSEVICDDWRGEIILKEVMVMRMGWQ